MKMTNCLAATGLIAIAVATSANAQDLGASSNGALEISVKIEPWGDALRAQNEFSATGFWTFNAGAGLMISAPSASSAGTPAEISLFARSLAPLTVRTSASAMPIDAATSSYGRELRRGRFTLDTVNSRSELGERNSQLFIIGTV